jgi:hypothetical protein
MALLANLLAVGMGSLFNEAPMIAEYTDSLRPAFNAKFDNASAVDISLYLSRNLITTNQYSDHYYIAMSNISTGTTLPPWVSRDYFFQRYEIHKPSKSNLRDVYNITTRGFGATANCTAIPTRRLPVFDDPLPNDDTRLLKDGQCGDGIDILSQEIRENSYHSATRVCASEHISTLAQNQGPVPCSRTMLMAWARNPKAEILNGTIDASFMSCHPMFETAMFNLTVDSKGHVLSYERTSDLETTLDYEGAEKHISYIFETVNTHWRAPIAQWHNDSLARDWMSYFTVLQTGSRDAIDPHKPPPDTEKLKPIIEDLYRRLFAIFLSLNEHLFDTKDESKPTTVVRRTEETRIFMEDASFILTMSILGLNTLVAVLFYSRAVPFVLPRLPTTLGSTLAYVAPSRLAGPTYRALPGNTSRTFSFGRYIGRDGDVHIGIEMDPHVVPVDPRSLKAQKGFLGRLIRRRSPESQDIKSGTWL